MYSSVLLIVMLILRHESLLSVIQCIIDSNVNIKA